MRLLLPPSETKRAGGRGRPLRRRDPHAVLGEPRRRTLEALAAVLARPDAGTALLLPDGVRDAALDANAQVNDAPTLPALRRYAGVVYDGLGYDQLAPAAQRVAGRSVFVFSGLFGVVRGDEAIPDYRVPAKAVLPGIGSCATYWRPVLGEVFAPMLGRGLVVDLRSSDYTAMWRPDATTAARVVTVRVLSPTPSGRLAVVSYASKLAKGQLAAALVTRAAAGNPARTAVDVADAWPGRAELAGDRRTQVVLYTAG